MLDRFVIFGASGDLTARLLMPALAQLLAGGELPDTLQVTGVGVDDWSTEHFRTYVGAALDQHAAHTGQQARQQLLDTLSYRQADVTNEADVVAAVGSSSRPLVSYLALPPALFPAALRALAAVDMADGSVLAIEKPFGTDLASARELNRLLERHYGGVTVFRNDHFLHSQTVQNILGFRFANSFFEPVWNATHVDKVEIVWDETLALEGRASYYDRAGALRDMLQNHLLQILCLIAMEPPVSFAERDLRDARFAVLRAIRPPDAGGMSRDTVRARYSAGTTGGRAVPDYVEEDGVDLDRGTETFAQITVQLANWRWAGVPFILRSGKAQAAKRAEVIVQFRRVPHPTFRDQEGCQPNEIRISLDPPSIQAGVNINSEDELAGLVPVTLSTALPRPARSAYTGLIRDVLAGDPTLSVRGDEAEESWRIVEPVLAAWADDAVPMRTYPAGTTPDWR